MNKICESIFLPHMSDKPLAYFREADNEDGYSIGDIVSGWLVTATFKNERVNVFATEKPLYGEMWLLSEDIFEYHKNLFKEYRRRDGIVTCEYILLEAGKDV